MSPTQTPHTAPSAEQVRAAWERVAGDFDDHVTPFTLDVGDEVVERIGVSAGDRFLDVAAGTGALAIPAARRGARVVATDISSTMMDRLRARARSEGLTDLDARVLDGHALDLPDDVFDVAASLNGVSLFGDIDRGLRELVRVTRPGGRVAVIAFGPPPTVEFLAFFAGALRAAVPGSPGLPTDPPPLPFQVADPEVLRGKLTAAGLEGIRVDPLAWAVRFRSAAHLLTVVRSSNPLGAQLLADVTSDQRAELERVLDGMLRERSGGSPDAVLHNRLHVAVGTV